jgi:hypothetical protein
MAAFVHRFTQFVEWPDSAFAGREDLEICVATRAPFLEALRQVVADREAAGRAFGTRAVRAPADLTGCHVLFVSYLADRGRDLIQAAHGRPILTIGDANDFLEIGGMISLRVVDRRMRFAVSVTAATDGGLRLSSQLLDLAIQVRGAGE